jgi:hypothetical protein
LQSEDRAAQDRRRTLADWYAEYGSYVFSIGGTRMNGAEAARALLAGDEFAKFHHASGSGTLSRGSKWQRG